MTGNRWIQEGSLIRCTVHNELFAKLGSCGACAVDPGPEIDLKTELESTPAPTPPGCDSPLTHERKLTAMAKRLEKLVRQLTRLEAVPVSSIVKLADTAIKARRAAGEYVKEREQAHLNIQLARHEKAMKQSGGDH